MRTYSKMHNMRTLSLYIMPIELWVRIVYTYIKLKNSKQPNEREEVNKMKEQKIVDKLIKELMESGETKKDAILLAKVMVENNLMCWQKNRI